VTTVLLLAAVCVLVSVLLVLGRGVARPGTQQELLQVHLQARAAERQVRDLARDTFLRMSAEAERHVGGGHGG
jgi:hypothetical protein